MNLWPAYRGLSHVQDLKTLLRSGPAGLLKRRVRQAAHRELAQAMRRNKYLRP